LARISHSFGTHIKRPETPKLNAHITLDRCASCRVAILREYFAKLACRRVDAAKQKVNGAHRFNEVSPRRDERFNQGD